MTQIYFGITFTSTIQINVSQNFNTVTDVLKDSLDTVFGTGYVAVLKSVENQELFILSHSLSPNPINAQIWYKEVDLTYPHHVYCLWGDLDTLHLGFADDYAQAYFSLLHASQQPKLIPVQMNPQIYFCHRPPVIPHVVPEGLIISVPALDTPDFA